MEATEGMLDEHLLKSFIGARVFDRLLIDPDGRSAVVATRSTSRERSTRGCTCGPARRILVGDALHSPRRPRRHDHAGPFDRRADTPAGSRGVGGARGRGSGGRRRPRAGLRQRDRSLRSACGSRRRAIPTPRRTSGSSRRWRGSCHTCAPMRCPRRERSRFPCAMAASSGPTSTTSPRDTGPPRTKSYGFTRAATISSTWSGSCRVSPTSAGSRPRSPRRGDRCRERRCRRDRSALAASRPASIRSSRPAAGTSLAERRCGSSISRANQPALLTTGDRVKFRPISLDEFRRWPASS